MDQMVLTFVILLVTTLIFITGKFRSDLVAMASLLTLILTGILTPNEALAGFSNTVVIMIAGLFVVGAGIFRTGIAKMIGKQLLKLAGKSEKRLLIIVMVVVAFFSAFISNTGTVAVLMPVVISMALEMKVSPSKLLIPLAYASSLGGVLTLIGTPPNLVISQALVDNGYDPLNFFAFTPIGLITLVVGLLFLVIFSKKILPNHPEQFQNRHTINTPKELANYYKLQNHLHKVRVSPTSPLVGQTLDYFHLSNHYNLTVVEVKRSGERKRLIKETLYLEGTRNIVFQADDILIILGNQEHLDQFKMDYKVDFVEEERNEEIISQLLATDFEITEVLLNPHSSFNKKTIEGIHFREKYNCNVLAINRKGKYIFNDISNVTLRFGDALLVHGSLKDISILSKETMDVVVIGEIDEDKVVNNHLKKKAPIAALNMVLMLVLMTFSIVSAVTAVLITAFLMVITGCLRNMDDVYRKINWESVVLIAAMLPIATALDKTGGVAFISEGLIQLLGTYGPFTVMAGFYIITMLLSQVISNTATAVIFAPIALTSAINMGVSPYPFLFAISIAASMAFATPIATPPNAIVMTAGGYKFSDFVKVGIPLQIVIAIVVLITLPLLLPF